MSASLEDVEREGQAVAEVTKLADAVRAWGFLDEGLKDRAVLEIEHPLLLEGVVLSRFHRTKLR